MRDKTKSQDEYCQDCLVYQQGGCNVILQDDEECEDREVLTCKNCGSHQFEIAPELYDEGPSLECKECGNTLGE